MPCAVRMWLSSRRARRRPSCRDDGSLPERTSMRSAQPVPTGASWTMISSPPPESSSTRAKRPCANRATSSRRAGRGARWWRSALSCRGRIPAGARPRSLRCSSPWASRSKTWQPRRWCCVLEPVRPIALSEIRDARKRIAGTIIRTPLVRLELGSGFPDVRLKLENLQPINAYKLRGAANAVALLSDAERRRGVWTISAGNAGQGVAYAARAAGVPCTVVAIETAPAAKLERMRALGAKLVLVPYGVAWQALDDRSYPGVVGTFIHPFDDQNFITGHATMGLEILEDAPDTAAIIAAIGGGGLVTGVASAVKALRSGVKVWGAEPETAAPAALSFAKGSAQVFPDWKATFVDGAGGKSVFPRMWQRMQPVVDGCIVVSLDETKRAMRLMAEKVRAIFHRGHEQRRLLRRPLRAARPDLLRQIAIQIGERFEIALRMTRRDAG